MEGDNDELSQKQGYLRTNILEKGYDADEFMHFLESKKGEDGLDLNNWNAEELRQSVQEFINSKGGQITTAGEPNDMDAPLNPMSELKSSNENNINNNNINNNNNQNSQSNENYQKPTNNTNNQISNTNDTYLTGQEEFLPCSKTELTTLSTKKNIVIHIAFPEKVEGGFLSKSFVSYLVQTDPFGYKVRKRYSDFDWLRNILSSHYINCVIPPLCKKNFGNRFDEQLISKRTRSIEKFVQALVTHPIIKHSKILLDFLSTEKDEDFNKLKNNYSKLSNPTSVKEIKTEDGFINVSINTKKETYFENIKDNAIINEELMQKITKSYKSLMDIMKEGAEKMKEISQSWKALYNKSIKYFESSNTSETYNILSKIMDDWASIQNRQINLINCDIREYVRFIKNEFNALTELGTRVEYNKGIFAKAFEKLKSTKEGLFKEKDLTQWGLDQADLNNKMALLQDPELAYSKMLPKDTKRVNELKNFYGMYLNSIIKEYERLRLLNGKRHNENILKFCQKFSRVLTDLQVSVADHLAYFDDMKDEEIEEESYRSDNNKSGNSNVIENNNKNEANNLNNEKGNN